MRKLEISNPDETRLALLEQMASSEESRFNHRMHGILLVISGQSCQQVAELFGEDRRTVQRWVKRYETDGLDGLKEGGHPGRPAALGKQQWEQLVKEYKSSYPRGPGRRIPNWDGKYLAAHLLQNYEVELGIRQCQRIIKILRPGRIKRFVE